MNDSTSGITLVRLIADTANFRLDPLTLDDTDSAIRALQRAEGFDSCFRNSPPPAFRHPYGECLNRQCLWHHRCQSQSAPRHLQNTFERATEIMNSSTELRVLVASASAKRGLQSRLENISNGDAIRYLQTLDGYTPCFGGPEPIKHASEDYYLCEHKDCIWKLHCDGLRKPFHVGIEPQSFRGEDSAQADNLSEKGTTERISKIMQEFYRFSADATDDKHLALLYFEFLLSREAHLLSSKCANRGDLTISVDLDEPSFDLMARSLPLVADTGILVDSSSARTEVYTHDKTDVAWDADTTHVRRYVSCPNVNAVGARLRALQPLTQSGTLLYLPRVWEETFQLDNNMLSRGTYETDPIADAIVRSRRVAHTSDRNPLIGPLVRPIVSLELPIIQSVPLEEFCKFTSDEREHFGAFRSFLRGRLLDLDRNEGSEDFEAGLMRIRMDIERGVRSISRDFSTLRRRRSFQALGGAIGSTVATLLAINGSVPGVITGLLGGGGGLLLALKAVEDAEIAKLRLSENPCYYLWLLERKSRL